MIARCVGGQAAMLSWSPAQGFEVEDVAAGPATTVTLTFEADTTEIGVRVDCQNQIPTVHVTTRADSDSDSD